MYYNINTKRNATKLPTSIGTLKNPLWEDLYEEGWREWDDVKEQVTAERIAENEAREQSEIEAEENRIILGLERMTPSVISLANILNQFGLTLPIDYDDVIDDIEQKLVNNELLPEQIALIGTLKSIYDVSIQRCGSDAAIARVWEIYNI